MRSQVWAATCDDSWPFIMRSTNFATSQPLFIVKGTVAATYNGIFESQESQMLSASSEAKFRHSHEIMAWKLVGTEAAQDH